MTFLNRILGTANVNDERYWSGYSPISVSGEPVSFNAALKLSAYYAGIKLIADTIGALPKHVIERMPDDTRVQATDHYLYENVHYNASEEQTSSEFFAMMTANATMRNVAYAQIVPGPKGFADQLIPIDYEDIRRVNTPGASYAGDYRYELRSGSQWKPYNKEDIFTLRFLQFSLKKNVDMLALMGDTVGTSLATLKYRGRFFKNDASPSGVIEYPGKLADKGYDNLAKSWHDAYSGGNQHKTAILENGAKYSKVGIDPKAAQLLESEEFNAEDVLRFIGVPPSLVGLPSRAVSWAGTGIEQQTLGFVTYNILAKLTAWKESISKYLILEPTRYYVDFVMDGLLRGDSTTRYNVYKVGMELGMFTPNDLLRFENRNPRTDPAGDEYVGSMGRSLSPAQVTQDAPATEDAPEDSPPEDTPPAEDTPEDAAANVFLIDAAARVVRKEIAAMNKAAKKFSGDSFAVEAHNFYLDHAAFVAEVMHIPAAAAVAYCEANAGELKQSGPACMADWETRRVSELVRMVTK